MQRPIVILASISLTVGAAIAVIEGCGLDVSGSDTTPTEAGTSASSSGTSGDPNALDDGAVLEDLDAGTDGANFSDSSIDAAPCPTGCDRCNDEGACIIDCLAASSCKNAVIACAADRPCLITCSGKTSCNGAVIACPTSSFCGLTCSGDDACKDTEITPGLDGGSCIQCMAPPAGAASCRHLACGLADQCELRCEDGGCSDVGCACSGAVCPL